MALGENVFQIEFVTPLVILCYVFSQLMVEI